jgi:hypothetical protein
MDFIFSCNNYPKYCSDKMGSLSEPLVFNQGTWNCKLTFQFEKVSENTIFILTSQ